MPEDSSAVSPYTVRNYRPADFEDLAGLYREAERLEAAGQPVAPQQITENLGRPNYKPEHDLFLVTRDGRPVGWLDMTPEPGIGRVILDGWLHPEHRGRGLLGKLLTQATRRAGELGARVAHVNVAEDKVAVHEILARLGFECVRRFFEYELDMTAFDRREAEDALRACRYLRPGEEDRLASIQNRSFAGTWGYNPNTPETIAYRTHLAHFLPQDVVLAEDGGRITGYCWTEVRPESGGREGRICMLGVDPDYRGRGLGRRMLLAGLAQLAGRGVKKAVLTVDSENQPACALYWSVGFTLRIGSLWYEKSLAPAPGLC